MKHKERQPGDPLIREIREVRQRLWQEGGGTVSGLMRVVERSLADRKTGRPVAKRRTGKRSRKAG